MLNTGSLHQSYKSTAGQLLSDIKGEFCSGDISLFCCHANLSLQFNALNTMRRILVMKSFLWLAGQQQHIDMKRSVLSLQNNFMTYLHSYIGTNTYVSTLTDYKSPLSKTVLTIRCQFKRCSKLKLT